jgi:hypothetical protein
MPGLELNHGESDAKMLAGHIRELLAAHDALRALVDPLGFVELILRVGNGAVDFEWIREHSQHRIIARSEYQGWDNLKD